MSVLLGIAPSRIGRVKVVRTQEPKEAYKRETARNDAADE